MNYKKYYYALFSLIGCEWGRTETAVLSSIVISTLAFIWPNAHAILTLWLTNGKTLFSVRRLSVARTTNCDALHFLKSLK